MKPSTTLIGWALGVLAAALLVPVALGATRPDDRAGAIGIGAAVAAAPVHPNDRAGTLGVGSVTYADPGYWRGERDYGLYRAGTGRWCCHADSSSARRLRQARTALSADVGRPHRAAAPLPS